MANTVTVDMFKEFAKAIEQHHEQRHEEWFMSKQKMNYIAVPLQLIIGSKKELEELPYRDVTNNLLPDTSRGFYFLVYSMTQERYSYNSKYVLASAPIGIHYCKTAEEFIAYMQSVALGADLSGLWSKP